MYSNLPSWRVVAEGFDYERHPHRLISSHRGWPGRGLTVIDLITLGGFGFWPTRRQSLHDGCLLTLHIISIIVGFHSTPCLCCNACERGKKTPSEKSVLVAWRSSRKKSLTWANERCKCLQRTLLCWYLLLPAVDFASWTLVCSCRACHQSCW